MIALDKINAVLRTLRQKDVFGAIEEADSRNVSVVSAREAHDKALVAAGCLDILRVFNDDVCDISEPSCRHKNIPDEAIHSPLLP